MSGMLQRLVGQAMGTQASGLPRVRSAMSVHAQAPIGLPHETAESRPELALTPAVPQQGSEPSRTPTPVQQATPREVVPAIRSAQAARESTPLAEPTPRSHSPLRPSPTFHAAAARSAPHDFAERAPPPLLEEMQDVSAPPAIKPAAAVQQPLGVAANPSRAEPTEVHVHIGRIEVIAAPEPAAAKQSRPAARNTRSLAEYLARRRPS